ncbi:MAG: cell division protein FtsZ [Dehalococcoidales bacterium]|jgi:cell division GTPase FtsZ|nr:cell division protein FtsZ [Dehalococcoidales bacterium]MDP6576753.1 tubulin/FtsZ family protein [Dehalococcoidales bacterium]MDP6825223.1 tubulin/FtsZ family protein [Dehalococcoidales bacterium]|tara:strand:+ start:2901 stop:4076 length:1176 start_codon:yes stop_codon:yes gene_type:complete
MKLIIVGFGQCGGRIADEFARLNRKARGQRGIDIITGAFAVNTDVADLSGLTKIKPDYQHRILIGGRKTGGHGVGKINELGAEIAREDGDKVIETIRSSRQFSEADAFLLVGGAAGGTGSGSVPVIAQYLKERYVDKPIYTLIVLPFEHEEATEERTVYNVATCLKSAYLVADAVFLVDNQRYVMKSSPIRSNLAKINTLIAAPFYNLLCAGEEKKHKYIGAKILDAGDIIQTVAGWTVIGYGQSQISFAKGIFKRTRDFRNKATETQKGTQTMDEAISGLSLKCNPIDSKRALYLVSAPAKEVNVDLIKELGTYLKGLAPEAIIRSGDYPREGGSLDITVILSELSDVEKIRNYFTKTISLISTLKKRQEGMERKDKGIEVTLKDIPSLL